MSEVLWVPLLVGEVCEYGIAKSNCLWKGLLRGFCGIAGGQLDRFAARWPPSVVFG